MIFEIPQLYHELISFNLFQAKIIDFNRALRKENISEGLILGKPGYFPIIEKWLNGLIQQVLWSLTVIILDGDMIKNTYFGCNSEEKSIEKSLKYFENIYVCDEKINVVKNIIVRKLLKLSIRLKEIEESIKQIQFQK